MKYAKIVYISFLFCLIASTAQALVAPIIPGQNLWCINQRIGETTDTILDIVSSILDCTCGSSSAACSVTAITTGNITLSLAGNYCLANDITGNITITANDVTLDLNNRTVNGLVNGFNVDHVNLKNGFITTPPSTATDIAAGILINTQNGYVSITNCVVDCSAGASGSGIPGRDGIDIAGSSLATNGVKIIDCEIIAGSGSAGSTISDNGGRGGTGINLNVLGNILIENNIITAGNGNGGGSLYNFGGDGIFVSDTINTLILNNSIIGGMGGLDSSPSGTLGGGNGGNGITLSSESGSNTAAQIKNNIIAAGNGGESNNGTGGVGGSGVYVDSTSQNCKIQFSTISGADAGLTTTAGGSANGGDGVTIVAGAMTTEVSNCIIAKTGAEANGGGNGYAVNDEGLSATSAIFGNVAYNLAKFTNNYNINVLSPAPLPVTSAGPVYGNYYFAFNRVL